MRNDFRGVGREGGIDDSRTIDKNGRFEENSVLKSYIGIGR
jgi:hypothetical protein